MEHLRNVYGVRHFLGENTCDLLNCIISDEIFNKFAAAKSRKLCLWSWIITSKALQAFSAKSLLVGVMETTKKSVGSLYVAAELWTCCCAYSLRFWARDFIFTPTSYIYVADIRISLSKLQSVLHNQHYKDHQVKRWDTHTPRFFIDNFSTKLPCRAFAILINQRFQNFFEPDWNLSLVNILRPTPQTTYDKNIDRMDDFWQ